MWAIPAAKSKERLVVVDLDDSKEIKTRKITHEREMKGRPGRAHDYEKIIKQDFLKKKLKPDKQEETVPRGTRKRAMAKCKARSGLKS